MSYTDVNVSWQNTWALPTLQVMTYLLLLRAFDTLKLLKLLKQINRFSEQYWGFHKALEPTEMDLTITAQKNELRNNCWTTFQQENDF